MSSPTGRESDKSEVLRVISTNPVGISPIEAHLRMDGANLISNEAPLQENRSETGEHCLVIRLSDFSGPEGMLEELWRASADDSFDFIYMHGENLEIPDGGYAATIEPYLRATKDHFDVFTALEIQPPQDLANVDELYAAAADGVNFPLGVFGGDRFQNLYPGKSRNHVLKALERAVGNWPNGTVLSTLHLGQESVASVVSTIDYLTKMGVIPHLVTDPGISGVAFDPTALERIYVHLYEAIEKAGISQSWLNHFEVTSSPFEGREIRDGKLRRRRSWLVRRIALEMLQFRRRLRVREVGRSLDSSGL